MKVVNAVAKVLKTEGVQYLFAYPVNPIIEAAAKVDIRPIKAFGGYGERIETLAQIIPAINRGIQKTQEGVPALLEFITDKELQTSKF